MPRTLANLLLNAKVLWKGEHVVSLTEEIIHIGCGIAESGLLPLHSGDSVHKAPFIQHQWLCLALDRDQLTPSGLGSRQELRS